MPDKAQIQKLDEILKEVAAAGCADKVAGECAEVLGVTASKEQREAVGAVLEELETKFTTPTLVEAYRNEILDILDLAA